MFNPPSFFFLNKKHPLTYTGYDCIMYFIGRQFSYYIDYPCDYYHKETNFFFLKSCAYYKIFYSKKWIYYEQIDIKFDLPFYETMQFDSFIWNMIFG